MGISAAGGSAIDVVLSRKNICRAVPCQRHVGGVGILAETKLTDERAAEQQQTNAENMESMVNAIKSSRLHAARLLTREKNPAISNQSVFDLENAQHFIREKPPDWESKIPGK